MTLCYNLQNIKIYKLGKDSPGKSLDRPPYHAILESQVLLHLKEAMWYSFLTQQGVF